MNQTMTAELTAILPSAEAEALEMLAMYEADGEQGIGQGDWSMLSRNEVAALTVSGRWELRWIGDDRRLFKI